MAAGDTDADKIGREEYERRSQQHAEEHLRITGVLQNLHDETVSMKKSLEDGRKAFERHEQQLDALQPKRRTLLEILGMFAGALFLIAGLVWTAAFLFSARPTTEEVTKAIEAHAAQPSHPDTQSALKDLTTTVNDVRAQQSSLGRAQDDIHADVAELKTDMKTLVRRGK